MWTRKAGPDNGPSDEDVQAKAWEMFKTHWNGLSSEQMDQVYEALGHKQAAVEEEGKALKGHAHSYEITITLTNVDGQIDPMAVADKLADLLYDHIMASGSFPETEDVQVTGKEI